jgi:hypothetical protein
LRGTRWRRWGATLRDDGDDASCQVAEIDLRNGKLGLNKEDKVKTENTKDP